ncbi:uncharacterized protein LOC105690610 isoform X1 [Athalia rosae]|uniref:uncharacterized protein LOC105690610 isoform X1 n=2 Tax=Athalia rosae TaxID=37344 RepID=UPI0020334BDD|nr:uncharacterized protein LOC105690610 isoform X1 [Athalia rosae]
MRAVMIWTNAVLVFMQLISTTIAQSDCNDDKDCLQNQYCYEASKLCANYTICMRYNRLEGSKPARHGRQCGACLEGYSAVKITESNQLEAESCTKNAIVHNENNDRNTGNNQDGDNVMEKIQYHWLVVLFVGLIISAASCGFVKLFSRCKNRDLSADTESNSSRITQTPTEASAPPLSVSQNNNNYPFTYGNLEEGVPLTYTVNSEVPVKARAFCNPDWVQADPTYNREGNFAIEPAHNNPPSNDEDTVPSSWTPGEVTVSVSNRPFSGLTSEQHDNTTNLALDRLVCPPSTDSQANHEDRQNFNDANPADRRGNHLQQINISINQHINQSNFSNHN